MNYKLLILLFFAFLVYSLQSIEKTSKATDEVPEKINLHISHLDVSVFILMNDSSCEFFTTGYCVGNVMNVTSKLVNNIGNMNTSGNLFTRISNRKNEIHNETWDGVNVSEGETKYYNTIYRLQNKDVDYSIVGSETFTAMSNYSFNEKFNYSICNFEVKKGIGIFSRFPGDITKTVSPSKTEIYPSEILLYLYHACNGTNVTLNKTKGIPGDWVSLSQNNTYLVPGGVNYIDVNITIPPLTPEGVYDNGTVYIYSDDPHAHNPIAEIKLIITVAMKYFILNVTTQEKKVCPGKTIPASINITKIIPSEDVNVSMTYQILDSNMTVYDEKKDNNIQIGNESVQKLYTLTVPSSAKTDYYMFLVTLDYNSTLTQRYDMFEVVSCIPPITPPSPGTGIEQPISPKTEVRAISLNLSVDTLTVITGNKTSFIASVKNIGSELVKSVKISIEGIPSEWVRVFPTTTDIDIGEVEEYLVVMNVPNNATPGIYKLKIKATDDIESNTVILTLIIGRDPKEIADFLLKELEGVRAEAKKSLLIGNCMDITVIKTFYQDAESSFEKGMNEYENRNYEGAVNWFEYALPIEKKVVNKVDITLELEIGTTNTSKFLIPPFYKSNEQFQLAGEYLEEKNYEKICDPLERIRKFILIGLIFWPGIVILFIILIILIIIFIRRRRGQERVKILEKVRERLRT
ncbi:MAG: NEW3 domain-containing protein [Candidatus Aenigmarchaeota archaeon]|nr:NEW3 domain-containing protein [Candidatus Aenigmarchaeota archaeon]